MKRNLILFVGLFTAAMTMFYFASDFLSLEGLKESQDSLRLRLDQNYFTFVCSFFLVYVGVTALSFPGAAVLTLAAGALFGLINGTIIVSFASTLGASLAFLLSRHFLSDIVEKKFGDKISSFKAGIKKEGPFFLFALRLVPVVPFFVINIAMGLTPIKTKTFWLVSQAGMLAGTLVYVNAGTQLSQIQSMSDIVSPDILFSFVLLGFFPIAAKKILAKIKN